MSQVINSETRVLQLEAALQLALTALEANFLPASIGDTLSTKALDARIQQKNELQREAVLNIRHVLNRP